MYGPVHNTGRSHIARCNGDMVVATMTVAPHTVSMASWPLHYTPPRGAVVTDGLTSAYILHTAVYDSVINPLLLNKG